MAGKAATPFELHVFRPGIYGGFDPLGSGFNNPRTPRIEDPKIGALIPAQNHGLWLCDPERLCRCGERTATRNFAAEREEHPMSGSESVSVFRIMISR